jgi:hypothetical protein
VTALRRRQATTGLAVLALSLACATPRATAAFSAHTTDASFQAAIAAAGGTPQTLTFEAAAAGTTVPDGSSLGGITFDFSPIVVGDQLQVSAGFMTTSGGNYLGTGVGANLNQVTAGDAIDLTFSQPISALGLFIITAEEIDAAFFAGDVEVSATVGTASNSATPEAVFGDGGQAFFIGIFSDTDTFTSAQIRVGAGVPDGALFYVIDDVRTAVVPEPSSFALTGLGLAGALAWARRRRHRLRHTVA